MPRIFDNLTDDSRLLPALRDTLAISTHADFCVGYINLRGWNGLAPSIDNWETGKGPCRVLAGMQKLPHDELATVLSLTDKPLGMDNKTAKRVLDDIVEQFRKQLVMGAPTNADEHALRQLASQLRSGKVVVKLFLRHTLHAKLYLLYRNDKNNPIIGYIGSSNLTFSGLVQQGELNLDVLDSDATVKLKKWFEDRWNDEMCIDITDRLVQIIEESWVRETPVLPYHIYLKMAYHISHEARTGLAEYKIPRIFGNELFDFQAAAVKIAAHHIYKRNGVLIGDVVGLGKTIMATAVARIFEEDYGFETLIICPKNLKEMWEGYIHRYGLHAKVIPLSQVLGKLSGLRRYRLVIIDESHNLRNREGKRYRAIREYIMTNESKCILLSATPYNKTYHDLSSQLRIFVSDDQDLGVRPEKLLREMGEVEFSGRHQASPRTLMAFDFSPHADDWRDLMRLYLVRRTRSFVQENYAETDPDTGRKFLTYENGRRSFFPARLPKTVKFAVDDLDINDQYARLYSKNVVNIVNALKLPRYGLGNYVLDLAPESLTDAENIQMQKLSRAGQRLTGFCRINMFKRLESGGAAFLLSVKRHLLRNYVFLHAIRNGLPLPIGTQDVSMLDSRFVDEDIHVKSDDESEGEDDNEIIEVVGNTEVWTISNLESHAAAVYSDYKNTYKNRFSWLRSDVFDDGLTADLEQDSKTLLTILQEYGAWVPEQDSKLEALYDLLTGTYSDCKVLVFTQFADTVRYLEENLNAKGLKDVAGVTGNSKEPTILASRFSPDSNQAHDQISMKNELRILITTDVLSEGQNLQDCHVVINYDLPWAIIRLIQRVGRVDRIGQNAETIHCLSFLPTDGIERIIDLRGRVCARLEQNAEVVGADEQFFEDSNYKQTILDLYHERAGILDDDADGEVDLASYAYQIWKNATSINPKIKKLVTTLPDVAFSSRHHIPTVGYPEGILVFVITSDGNNALAYVDRDGRSITESQLEILQLAECKPDTPAQPRHEIHHDLVGSGVRYITREEQQIGGDLGRPSGARYRVYARLKAFASSLEAQSIDASAVFSVLSDIYNHPLRSTAVDTLNRQMRIGVDDKTLAQLAVTMRDDDQLCMTEKQNSRIQEPRIICSMGLFRKPSDR